MKECDISNGLSVGKAACGVVLFGVLMLLLNGGYFLKMAEGLKYTEEGAFDWRGLYIKLATPVAKVSEVSYGLCFRRAVESSAGAWVNDRVPAQANVLKSAVGKPMGGGSN